jgi:hypothetical protein
MLYVKNVDKDHSIWKIVKGGKGRLEQPDDSKVFLSAPVSSELPTKNTHIVSNML